MNNLGRVTLIFSMTVMSTAAIFSYQAGGSGNRSRDYWPTEGWRTSEPEKQKMDANWLELLRMHIPEKLPQIRSVIIVRHGYIVFEEYYRGLNKDDLHNIASVTKSVTSILTGIAIREGLIKNIERPVEKYFSELDTGKRSPQFKEITLKHILTMTSGFEWSDSDFPKFMQSPNQVQFTTELHIAHAPGTEFNYNTPATHLLSYILKKTTGKTSLEYAGEKLFGPLGISACNWPSDSQGLNLGGNDISMRTRDLAKLGFLYLNLGQWDKKQIVTEDWVRESTKQQSSGGPPEGERYGYLWWVTNIKGHPAFFAGGYGGQFIYVIPDMDLVVIITSDMDRPHIENRGIIGDFIIPAIEK